MKSLFKKYIQSVISPDEFDQLCDYINSEKNTASVSEAMKLEWKQFLHENDHSRINPELLQKVQHLILVEDGARAKRKLKFYTIGLRIAAVLVVGLLIASFWLYQQEQSFYENSPTQTVSIPYGAQTQLIMPDGSTVWLNSGSKLTYSTDFSKQRQVELKGEAFFDVVKDEVPFEVNTSYGKVEVLGTAFNVQAYPDGRFVTTLERGLVKVIDGKNDKEEIINPGDQVRLANGKFVKSKVNTELFTSWKEGKLIFSREPFPDMINRLERWFNVGIEYSVSDFKGLWFSGTIEGETLTEVMGMICKAAPVDYSYNSRERKIKIVSKP